MTRAQIVAREIVRWIAIITIFNLAHQSLWALAIAIILSRITNAKTVVEERLPAGVVQVTVDGKTVVAK